MKQSINLSTVPELRELNRLVVLTTVGLLLLGIFFSDSLDDVIGYSIATVAVILPAVLWVRLGVPGVPILPAVAAVYYIYFALPILHQNLDVLGATPSDILRAAATMSLFLNAATAIWWFLVRNRTPTQHQSDLQFTSAGHARGLIMGGLVVGVVFELGVLLGVLGALGTFYGVLRALALAVAAIACYLSGCYRARGELRGQVWVFICAAIVLLIVLSWSSLLLVGGMQFALAAALGFVITSKRIPWKLLLPVGALMFILHAGKADVREQYWNGSIAQNISVSDIPDVFAEWIEDGVVAVANGQTQGDLFDRASLLYRLIFVQQLTPDAVPYLDGKTYALVGSYLVPRFLDPGKAASQAGMNLLNITYGIESEEDVRTTAIGWGIVPEAFANFGYSGVLTAGLAFGALAAIFTCLSIGAGPLALSTLLSVAALVTMTNVESDFGYLLVNLWQALGATLLFFLPLKFLSPRSAPASTRLMGVANTRLGK